MLFVLGFHGFGFWCAFSSSGSSASTPLTELVAEAVHANPSTADSPGQQVAVLKNKSRSSLYLAIYATDLATGSMTRVLPTPILRLDVGHNVSVMTRGIFQPDWIASHRVVCTSWPPNLLAVLERGQVSDQQGSVLSVTLSVDVTQFRLIGHYSETLPPPGPHNFVELSALGPMKWALHRTTFSTRIKAMDRSCGTGREDAHFCTSTSQ